ncbi:uncharacterized protein LOC114746432 [Neltuma alba]|uniref:uncharacterized protein LOC114746432 n=1 Tax=Neltuma alba TaxID=207710 RepID=UPI0010A3A5C3|nr:uncharacterized protein LOC114746432 [Prosopis alba]
MCTNLQVAARRTHEAEEARRRDSQERFSSYLGPTGGEEVGAALMPSKYVLHSNLHISEMPVILSMSTSVGLSVRTTQVCLNLTSDFKGRRTIIDLICLPLQGMDVIIGMNWLSCNNTVLDCRKRVVVFPEDVVPIGLSSGSVFLSAVQVDECIQKGCQAYTLFFSRQVDTEEGIDHIDVVREFPKVFPKEMTRLPLEREVEFTIDLMPSTTPISKTPYRMSPSELNELKRHMEELLEKGFIRPSVSPWGSLVLFVKKKDGSMRLCIDYQS